MEIALHEGKYPVIDILTDVFAIPSASGKFEGRVCTSYHAWCVVAAESSKSQVYFMGLIDVLTNYGARKRAAHAAKTMKHGVGHWQRVKNDDSVNILCRLVLRFLQ